MDLSIILETKKTNIIKNTKRTIDKLFLLHKQNKITDFSDKIDRLKELITKNIKEIEDLNDQIKRRSEYNPIIFYIAEYFNMKKCYKSSSLLCEKYDMESDISFFLEQDGLIKDCENDSFLSLIKYIKDYKNIFKMYDIEESIKIKHFLHLCKTEQYEEGVSFFRKNDIDKKYLINLVCLKNITNDFYKTDSCLNTPGLDNSFKDDLSVLKEAFGISNTRIQKKIEYGLISFKTRMCYKYQNKECPSCQFVNLRREVPFNRREHSIILCRGSQEPICEENRGFAYESGHVYGEKYVKEKGYKIEDNKYPRQCFFM